MQVCIWNEEPADNNYCNGHIKYTLSYHIHQSNCDFVQCVQKVTVTLMFSHLTWQIGRTVCFLGSLTLIGNTVSISCDLRGCSCSRVPDVAHTPNLVICCTWNCLQKHHGFFSWGIPLFSWTCVLLKWKLYWHSKGIGFLNAFYKSLFCTTMHFPGVLRNSMKLVSFEDARWSGSLFKPKNRNYWIFWTLCDKYQ